MDIVLFAQAVVESVGAFLLGALIVLIGAVLAAWFAGLITGAMDYVADRRFRSAPPLPVIRDYTPVNGYEYRISGDGWVTPTMSNDFIDQPKRAKKGKKC